MRIEITEKGSKLQSLLVLIPSLFFSEGNQPVWLYFSGWCHSQSGCGSQH